MRGRRLVVGTLAIALALGVALAAWVRVDAGPARERRLGLAAAPRPLADPARFTDYAAARAVARGRTALLAARLAGTTYGVVGVVDGDPTPCAVRAGDPVAFGYTVRAWVVEAQPGPAGVGVGRALTAEGWTVADPARGETEATAGRRGLRAVVRTDPVRSEVALEVVTTRCVAVAIADRAAVEQLDADAVVAVPPPR